MEVKNKADESKFLKEQLLASEKFAGKRDILNAILADGEFYTINETETVIEKYMKGGVK